MTVSVITNYFTLHGGVLYVIIYMSILPVKGQVRMKAIGLFLVDKSQHVDNFIYT